ncbi:MAG: hypothetical protein FWB85_02915 [Chitinispirillia bacterium]|nr:hypothetical protein [Chitinispirillia bacterium]
MKKIFLLCALTVLAFTNVGCEDTDITLRESNSLSGTSWKLAAFVDVENGAVRAPERPDYGGRHWGPEGTYTITFDDSNFSGTTVANSLYGWYSVNYDTDSLSMGGTQSEVGGDPNDARLFVSILFAACYFQLYSNELHIFYNDGNEYLKFKKTEGGYNEY